MRTDWPEIARLLAAAGWTFALAGFLLRPFWYLAAAVLAEAAVLSRWHAPS